MSQQVPRKAIHKVEAWQPAPASAVASVPASSAASGAVAGRDAAVSELAAADVAAAVVTKNQLAIAAPFQSPAILVS